MNVFSFRYGSHTLESVKFFADAEQDACLRRRLLHSSTKPLLFRLRCQPYHVPLYTRPVLLNISSLFSGGARSVSKLLEFSSSRKVVKAVAQLKCIIPRSRLCVSPCYFNRRVCNFERADPFISPFSTFCEVSPNANFRQCEYENQGAKTPRPRLPVMTSASPFSFSLSVSLTTPYEMC